MPHTRRRLHLNIEPPERDEVVERVRALLDVWVSKTAGYLAVKAANRADLRVVPEDEYQAILHTLDVLKDDQAMEDIRRAAAEPDDEAVDYDELRRQRGLAKA
jgi:hypothetical protein